jgi:hypothetical protein
MALVGAGVAGSVVSGSVGGVTFQRSLGKRIAKRRARRKVNGRKVGARVLVRLARAGIAWSALGAADRAAWSRFAAAGGEWGPGRSGAGVDGRCTFLGLSAFEECVRGEVGSGVPVVGPVRGLTGFSVSGSATGPSLVLSWTGGALGVDEWLTWRFGFPGSWCRAACGSGLYGPYGLSSGLSSPIEVGSVLAGVVDLFQVGRTFEVRCGVWDVVKRRFSGEQIARCVISV